MAQCFDQLFQSVKTLRNLTAAVFAAMGHQSDELTRLARAAEQASGLEQTCRAAFW